MAFVNRVRSWLRRQPVAQQEHVAAAPKGRQRGQVDHVIILDGTLSSLDEGFQTNAGLLFGLVAEGALRADRRVYYEPGIQWDGWWKLGDIAQGKGINRQIKRAYGWLASGYREGDRIFLFGYSRGAFAVRSLAGVIDRVGLVRREMATERAIEQAYRHYRAHPEGEAARAFAAENCHPSAMVDVVGVWDTVKALGLRLPLLWMLTEGKHRFHDQRLGRSVRHGFHALALHETRVAFEPVLWQSPPDRDSKVEQVWFRGAHGDVGGQIGHHVESRPLSNIPLVWMLEKVEGCGLSLPAGWRGRFPCDAGAPMLGTVKSWGKLFLLRRPRAVGSDASERLHSTAEGQRAWSWVPWPLTRLY